MPIVKSAKSSSSAELEHQQLERLSRAFVAAGWKIVRKRGSSGPQPQVDLAVFKAPYRYAAELKLAREPRRQEIQAMLAAAILQSRKHAKLMGGRPLAIVGAPHISDAISANLREYAEEFAAGCAWGCLDGRGRFELHGPGLEKIAPRPSEQNVPRADSIDARVSRSDLFSDLGQWILKVLFAQRLPEKYLRAERIELKSASQLAISAGVSIPHAARQVARLREEGFLVEERGLRLVRSRELLEQWSAANRRPAVECPAKWIFPQKDSAKELSKSVACSNKRYGMDPSMQPPDPLWRLGTPRLALGLFSAADALGLRFVHGAPMHVYAEHISASSLEQLGLTKAEPGERVDVFVRQPRFPEAVFRGSVLAGGVPVADILQCWLDVAGHPARGAELAAEIWKQVLAPTLIDSHGRND